MSLELKRPPIIKFPYLENAVEARVVLRSAQVKMYQSSSCRKFSQKDALV